MNQFIFWDKENNVMIYPGDDDDLYISPHGKVYQFLYFENHSMMEEKDYIPLPYTGVNDKFGKKIYLGHVLQYDSKFKHHQENHPVTFNDGSFDFWKEEMTLSTMNMKYKNGYKIVGHIYENQELV